MMPDWNSPQYAPYILLGVMGDGREMARKVTMSRRKYGKEFSH